MHMDNQKSTHILLVRNQLFTKKMVLKIKLGLIRLCFQVDLHSQVFWDCASSSAVFTNTITGKEQKKTELQMKKVPDTEEVTPLPYVYTDFIKPRESSQASAAAQHFEDFGYSEVGPTSREEAIVLEDFGYSEVGPTSREETAVLGECVSNEQPTACPDAGEE